MAKGKHSAALFEVIHSDKRFRKSGQIEQSGSLKTPKWWFKTRDKSAADASEIVASAPQNEAASVPETAPSEPVFDPTASMPSYADHTPPPAPIVKTSVEVVPERSEIRFKLTYTSAIVAGFAVIVIVGLAYMIGQHAKMPASAQARPTETPLAPAPMTVQKGILNVAPRGSSSDSNANPRVATPRLSIDATSTKAPVATPAPAPVTTDDENGFIMGRNYVIAQAYPEKASAEHAAEVLQKNGVKVRVVLGPKNHTKSWYSVVGTKPFDRLSNNPEYDRYVKKMIEAGQALKGSNFDKIKPSTVKWAGESSGE